MFFVANETVKLAGRDLFFEISTSIQARMKTIVFKCGMSTVFVCCFVSNQARYRTSLMVTLVMTLVLVQRLTRAHIRDAGSNIATLSSDSVLVV